jgi:DNA-binding transcriptional regulator YdaS (Cro superfamily)
MPETGSSRERTRNLLIRAIAFAGSEAKLGRAIGRSQNAVWQAKRRGSVTAEMALAIDVATAGQISKSDLRPDLFGSEGRVLEPAL